MDDLRVQKLNKIFHSVINDATDITASNYSLFLESICAQLDPVSCVHEIATSKFGLRSLHKAMCRDLSNNFINGLASRLITYLQEPELQEVGEGKFLRDIVLSIAEPPIFWNAFVISFRVNSVRNTSQVAFAWLLLRLVSLPGKVAGPYRDLAKDDAIMDKLLKSSNAEARLKAYKILHIVGTNGLGNSYQPGGRHDNDFADFRKISIMPTADELISKEPAFLRTVEEQNKVEEDQTVVTHLDNQFRLLREDLLYEMREEIQVAFGIKKGHHRGLTIDGLKLLSSPHRSGNKSCKWGIALQCRNDFWFFRKDRVGNMGDRKAYLYQEQNRRLLKHQSLVCLIVDGVIVAFPIINRDEERLSENPPVIVLQLEGKLSTTKALTMLMKARQIKIIQIDTAVFAYEHVLKRLQKIKTMPLHSEILLWKSDDLLERPDGAPSRVIQALKQNPSQDLKSLLRTPDSIFLDKSQLNSLISGLTQKVSLIQGPPGTGKSFVGALIAKVLHDEAHKILVCCYTNHALDQFLEDLMVIGIPESNIVRLGSKATPKTESLALSRQNRHNFGHADHQLIDSLRSESNESFRKLEAAFKQCKFAVVDKAILSYLEFHDKEYFKALSIPRSSLEGGMQIVGRRGKAITPTYLLRAWIDGRGPGFFKKEPNIKAAAVIWKQSIESRREKWSKWQTDLLKERVENVYKTAERYNFYQSQLDAKFSESDSLILQSKRIIGCTTTAAAKYSSILAASAPGVVLVEEAGEILESHVLTSLGSKAKQLILIGDHKQLRPKISNYNLTVEKGEGYDLNRSLFERLILKEYPHSILSKQHRMRPEIASLVRNLTYPELIDAEGTKNRPNLLGVRDNIIFINHEKPEDEMQKVADLRDAAAKSSKQNKHEVAMVLKIVRYLGQQGYGTDKIVILTPYLGQLFSFMEALKEDNDPVLNDLDSFDLVRAGLLPASASKKKSIRLATIDNYQGEESDIVVVSLTRSNGNHDIGFMSSPQRVNVLLSRARNALILIGNSETFVRSRKGGELWVRLINLLKEGGHLYEGLPVKCERHPDRSTLLSRPEDFDKECPDGGCKEACQTLLSCGIHICPSRCHQLYDHSKIKCDVIISATCIIGHTQFWKCSTGRPLVCYKCLKEARDAEKRREDALELQQKREAEEGAHLKELSEIDTKISLELQKSRDVRLAKERESDSNITVSENSGR